MVLGGQATSMSSSLRPKQGRDCHRTIPNYFTSNVAFVAVCCHLTRIISPKNIDTLLPLTLFGCGQAGLLFRRRVSQMLSATERDDFLNSLIHLNSSTQLFCNVGNLSSRLNFFLDHQIRFVESLLVLFLGPADKKSGCSRNAAKTSLVNSFTILPQPDC